MVLVLDLYALVDHLALYHQPFALADHVQVFFFQQDHIAWSFPPVCRAYKSFFLAYHAQECAHIGVAHYHDVASYMIGCLDHYIRDNHLPMAMSTLLPCYRQ